MSREKALRTVIIWGDLNWGVGEGETLEECICWSCRNSSALFGRAVGNQEEKVGFICGTQPHLLLCGEGWSGVGCCMVCVAWLQGLCWQSLGDASSRLVGEVMREA